MTCLLVRVQGEGVLASSLISFLLMFHSCSLPFKGPRSTTATLQGQQVSSSV